MGMSCLLFAVGSLVGAVTGSMVGLATESGMLRGAGIGAISGAVFSIEVAESSRDLWHSADSGVWSLLYMVRHCTDHTHLILICCYYASLDRSYAVKSVRWHLYIYIYIDQVL